MNIAYQEFETSNLVGEDDVCLICWKKAVCRWFYHPTQSSKDSRFLWEFCEKHNSQETLKSLAIPTT